MRSARGSGSAALDGNCCGASNAGCIETLCSAKRLLRASHADGVAAKAERCKDDGFAEASQRFAYQRSPAAGAVLFHSDDDAGTTCSFGDGLLVQRDEERHAEHIGLVALLRQQI